MKFLETLKLQIKIKIKGKFMKYFIWISKRKKIIMLKLLRRFNRIFILYIILYTLFVY